MTWPSATCRSERHDERPSILTLNRKRPEDKSDQWRPRRSIRCYLDDVDEILSTVKDIGEIEVDTGDFLGVISSADELRVVDTRTLDDLTISVTSVEARLEVNIAPQAKIVLAPRDNLLLQGAAQRVQSVLRARMLRFGALNGGTTSSAWAESPLFATIGGLAMAATLLGFGLTLGSMSTENSANSAATAEGAGASTALSAGGWVAAFFAIATVLALALALGAWGRFGWTSDPRGTLVVAYHDEVPSFWRQNKTAIIIGLTTNVIVGFLFFFLGQLTAG